jgi:hypothetical protein
LQDEESSYLNGAEAAEGQINANRRQRRGTGMYDAWNRKIKQLRYAFMRMKSISLFRIQLRIMVKSQIFYWLVITLVFLNTVCVASEHHGQPQYFTDFLKYAEFAFLGIFIGEVLIKLFAMGYRTYFASKFNRFDCLVIVGR